MDGRHANIILQLKKRRAEERQAAINNGFMADPDVQRKLADAITIVGTCQDMCPEYERVTRMVQNDVWKQENVSKRLNGFFISP
jgi:hypothetical protein